MSWQRIIIRHSGQWYRSEYTGGDEVLVYMPVGQISRDNLIREIHEQVESSGASDYMLFYTTNTTDGRKIKVSLKTDTDLLRLLVEQKDDPTVYVVEKGKQGVAAGHHVEPVQEDYIDETTLLHREGGHVSSEDEEEDENRRREIFDSLTTEFGAWIQMPGHLDRVIGQRSFSSDHHSGGQADTGDQDHAAHELRNWVIPLLEETGATALKWVEPSGSEIGDLLIDSTFHSKDDLTIAVGLYHMQNHVEYMVDRSSKSRLGFVCKHGNSCPFKLRAVQNASIWRIIKFTPIHTCDMDLNRTAPRQVPAKVVGKYYSQKLISERVVLKPKEMIGEMQRLFGIEMDYTFALRARNIAIEMTYGDFDRSYQMLPSYLHLLRETNPGTLYDIETTHDGEFRHLFLALGQSLHAFVHHLRPVIVVDGTHLKGKNKGILFVAVTKDGNEGVFPLAVGIGPIENDESWTWFFTRLRMCFGHPDDLLIVSDQHKSIRNAVESVYPNVAHALCYYHLQKNLAHYGRHMAALFKAAAYAYRSETFDKNFAALGVLKETAHRHLLNIGQQRWARSQCPVRRSSFMTSNAAETMNARLLWARRLPICSMLEAFRSVVENWFDERRASALSRSHDLTEEAWTKLHVSVEKGRQLTVRGTTTHIFKVEEENKTYLVDLDNRTCDCQEFNMDEIPCRHACAAIRRAGLQVTDFVARYYKQSALLGTYASCIASVPHPGSWNVPDSVSLYIIRPPIITRQAGRPRMSRARSAVEGSRRQVCSRCKGLGHNRRNCTAPLVIEGVDLNVAADDDGDEQAPTATIRRRQKKKCSVCRSDTHTRNACPMRVDE